MGIKIFSGIRGEYSLIRPTNIINLVRNFQSAKLIHVHGLFTIASIAGAIISLIFRKRLTVQPHGSLGTHRQKQSEITTKKKLFLKFGPGVAFRRAACFVVTDSAEEIQLNGLGFSNKKARISYSQMPPHLEDHLQSINLIPVPELPTCYLVTVCRDAAFKRLDLIVGTWIKVSSEIKNLGLVIVGDISEKTKHDLMAMLERRELAQKLIFTGHRVGSQKQQILMNASAFISLSDYENFAIVVVEALHAGIPVITRSTVGASVLVKNSDFALVLKDEDQYKWEKQIFEKLTEWQSNKTLHDEIVEFTNSISWKSQANIIFKTIGGNNVWTNRKCES